MNFKIAPTTQYQQNITVLPKHNRFYCDCMETGYYSCKEYCAEMYKTIFRTRDVLQAITTIWPRQLWPRQPTPAGPETPNHQESLVVGGP